MSAAVAWNATRTAAAPAAIASKPERVVEGEVFIAPFSDGMPLTPSSHGLSPPAFLVIRRNAFVTAHLIENITASRLRDRVIREHGKCARDQWDQGQSIVRYVVPRPGG